MVVKAKNQYFQFLRGLAIIFVILIHCYSGFNYEKSSLDYHLYIITRSAIGIAVPVFFAVSGYFSARSKDEKKKILDMRLIIPFIVWSVIYQIYKEGFVSLLTAKGIIKMITGQSASHLYFVFVLVQIRLIMPLIKKWNGKVLTFGIIVLTALWFSLYYLIRVLGVIANPLPFSLTDFFPAWIIYWYIGYMVKESNFIKRISSLLIIAGVIITFLLTVLETYCHAELMETVGNINPVSQMKLSNLLFCLLVCILIFKFERNVTTQNILTHIGDVSYGIYYIHFLIIFIIEKYAGVVLSLPLYAVQAIYLSITLLSGVIIVKSVQKVLGKNISARILRF